MSKFIELLVQNVNIPKSFDCNTLILIIDLDRINKFCSILILINCFYFYIFTWYFLYFFLSAQIESIIRKFIIVRYFLHHTYHHTYMCNLKYNQKIQPVILVYFHKFVYTDFFLELKFFRSVIVQNFICMCVQRRKKYTILSRPSNKMWQNAINNVMVDSFHVLWNCSWNKGSHVHDVANKKAWFGATHTLSLHDFSYTHWSEPVTWDGVIGNFH